MNHPESSELTGGLQMSRLHYNCSVYAWLFQSYLPWHFDDLTPPCILTVWHFSFYQYVGIPWRVNGIMLVFFSVHVYYECGLHHFLAIASQSSSKLPYSAVLSLLYFYRANVLKKCTDCFTADTSQALICTQCCACLHVF